MRKGFVAILATLLVLTAGLVIVLSAGYISLSNIKAVRNNIYSVQAYYAAEAGIEDSLLRLIDPVIQDPNPDSYSLTVGEAETTLDISEDPISGSYTIISDGNKSNRIRKVKTVLAITTTDVSFHYGVQVGAVGLIMEDNSRVMGNIYSNGPIAGDPESDADRVYGDVYSASSSGRIDGLKVKQSAHANTISRSYIEENAYYQNIDEDTTVLGERNWPWDDPLIEPMPILEEEITNWKDSADDYIFPDGNYTLEDSEDSRGPMKVNGDFTLESNAVLTITGTIWVTGNVYLNSNAILQLDPSYGSLGGVIVVDGKVLLDSNIVICGSEGYIKKECNPSVGSYLMILSTNSSLNPDSPAIFSKSNTTTAILYANQGMIVCSSNAKLKEATAKALHLKPNAEVTYESGLANAQFTSGPGASYKVAEWEEIE